MNYTYMMLALVLVAVGIIIHLSRRLNIAEAENDRLRRWCKIYGMDMPKPSQSVWRCAMEFERMGHRVQKVELKREGQFNIVVGAVMWFAEHPPDEVVEEARMEMLVSQTLETRLTEGEIGNWETEEGWEKKVCRAVIEFPFAPRDAKQILNLAGSLKSKGMSTERILVALQELLDEDGAPLTFGPSTKDRMFINSDGVLVPYEDYLAELRGGRIIHGPDFVVELPGAIEDWLDDEGRLVVDMDDPRLTGESE